MTRARRTGSPPAARWPVAQLARLEEADHAVLAVVARDAPHLAAAQPADRLAEQLAAGLADRRPAARRAGCPAPGRARRPARCSCASTVLDFGADAVDLAEDLVQLDQVGDPGCVGRAGSPPAGRPAPRPGCSTPTVSGLPHSGQRPPCLAGLRRLPVDAAGPVAVGVVLALLREELDRAGEPVAGAQRLLDREVVQRRWSKQRRLAGQRLRRVRVRVGDQAVAVQAGHPPVHLRVGGQAGLHREDVVGQVGVAVGDRVEAGLRAQRGEPRRPDVRRHQVAVRAGLQRDLQQVARVQAEDRAAVGGRGCRSGPSAVLNRADRVEVGQVDQVVHLAGPVVALVDRGDLHREHEPDRSRRRCEARRQPLAHLVLARPAQPEEARLGRRRRRLAQVVEPGGWVKSPVPSSADALAPGPPGQVRRSGRGCRPGSTSSGCADPRRTASAATEDPALSEGTRCIRVHAASCHARATRHASPRSIAVTDLDGLTWRAARPG